MFSNTPKRSKKRCFFRVPLFFFLDVSDKCQPVSRVFLPKISDTLPKWKVFCPSRSVRLLSMHNLLTQKPFQKHSLTKINLIKTMQLMDNNVRDFKSHSLRISSHTFFITYGLPKAFVQFFARRNYQKSLMYRGLARLTLCKLREFARKWVF